MDGGTAQASLPPGLDQVRPSRPLEVVDVGANPIEEVPAYLPLVEGGLATLLAFEPQDVAYAALVAEDRPGRRYRHAALGDGGPVDLHVTNQSGLTSIFAPNPPVIDGMGWRGGARVLETVTLDTARLDDLVEPGSIDFLKIDVQGAELGILQAGRAALSKAVAIQTEIRFIPLYDGEPSFGELDAELQHQGFALHAMLPIKRGRLKCRMARRLPEASRAQVVDCDAIYVRDLWTPDALEDEGHRRLALLAGAALGLENLALRSLVTLEGRGALPEGTAGRYLKAVEARAAAGPA